MAGDDGLLVGLGDGHRIAQTQFALFDQHGVAERQKLRILDQPVGNFDAGDLRPAVEIVEVAPLLAGGQSQGEAGVNSNLELTLLCVVVRRKGPR